MSDSGPSQAYHKARHRETWELIPWVVIGRASDAESETVRVHCLQCSGCTDELNFQRILRREMVQERGPDFDSERGWEGMLRDIDIRSDEASTNAIELSSASARPTLRLRQVLAIMAVEALVLGFAGAALLYGSGQAGQHYQTLALPAQTPRDATIRLVVSNDLTVAQLQTLLGSLKVQIVEGPSELGGFALAPIDPGIDSAAAVARLRATPGVRLAEPIR